MSSGLLDLAFNGEAQQRPAGVSAQVSPELFKQGVIEHAVWLGMDPDVDKKFLWIAERSLVAKLPLDWVQLKTADEGHPYYYNQVTQESRWDHPSDNEYRDLFRKKKEEAMQQNTLSSPRHYHPTSPMSSPSASEQNLSTFSVNTPPAPPRSPSDFSISGRQRARISAERDSAVELNAQLKSEIEEEMQRGIELHKRLKDTEAKLDSANRQIQRLKMDGGSSWGVGLDGEAAEELRQAKETVGALKDEVGRLKRDAKLKAPAAPTPADIQEIILHVDAAFEECIGALERSKPKHTDHEVKAMVEEVEMMCSGYRKVLRMPAMAMQEEGKEEGKDDRGDGASAEKLAELESKLATYKTKNMDLNARLSDLEVALENLTETHERLKNTHSNLKDSSDESMRSLEKQVSRLKSSLDDLANSSSKKENDHPVQLAKLEAKILESKEKIGGVTRQKEELEGTIADCKDKLEKKTGKIEGLTKTISTLEAEKSVLETSIEENEKGIASWRENYTKTRDKLKAQEAKNSEMELDFNSEKESLAEASKSQKLKNNQLQDDLEAMTKNYDLTTSDLAEAKEDASSAWKKWDSAIKNNEKLSKKMEKMEFTTQEALREVAEMKSRIERLEEENKIVKDDAMEYQAKFMENQKKIKKLNEHIVTLQGNIRVFCRLRPLSEREEDELRNDADAPDMAKSIQYLDDGKMLFHGAMYEYDYVFNPETSQTDVFTEVQSAIASAMDGFRVCIFAYGQTGSGKTYTMEGPRVDRGVNFRALEEMFNLAAADGNVDYDFNVSVLEVYNETVCDLLVRGSGGTDLAIRKNKDEVFVEGLTECVVENATDVEELMQLASRNRSTASNNVNEHSSRSHLVLSVKVAGMNRISGTKIVGKLNLIDLAGSERLKNTAASGQRLKEAKNINKSLSALGDVVSALGDKKSGHVPYRNSKLTFLLQDSLRASAKVLMFVNINPAPKSAGESICSLNFAARCRAVQLGKARKDNITIKG